MKKLLQFQAVENSLAISYKIYAWYHIASGQTNKIYYSYLHMRTVLFAPKFPSTQNKCVAKVKASKTEALDLCQRIALISHEAGRHFIKLYNEIG